METETVQHIRRRRRRRRKEEEEEEEEKKEEGGSLNILVSIFSVTLDMSTFFS